MGIRCCCPNGHKHNVKAEQAGKVGICPICNLRFQIPFGNVPTPTSHESTKPVSPQIAAKQDPPNTTDSADSTAATFYVPEGCVKIESGRCYDANNRELGKIPEDVSSVVIPNSVTEIGSNAFEVYSSLTHINIPNSVSEIGRNAFRRCSKLTNVNIPNSVTRIGWYAFEGCSSLTNVNIPNSVTEIGSYAFQNCTSLTHVNIQNSVEIICEGAFKNCSSLTHVNIPSSVTEIGMYAFEGCASLTHVDIPNSVKKISVGVFKNCSKLTHVNIPNSVTEISFDAFRRCVSLAHVNIPNSVSKIGWNAFEGSTSLKANKESPLKGSFIHLDPLQKANKGKTTGTEIFTMVIVGVVIAVISGIIFYFVLEPQCDPNEKGVAIAIAFAMTILVVLVELFVGGCVLIAKEIFPDAKGWGKVLAYIASPFIFIGGMVPIILFFMVIGGDGKKKKS